MRRGVSDDQLMVLIRGAVDRKQERHHIGEAALYGHRRWSKSAVRLELCGFHFTNRTLTSGTRYRQGQRG
jgi:hypothetical protein